MFTGSTRALLEQHISDCREDRERTADQFGKTADKLDKLEEKFEKYIERQDGQHEESQGKLDKLQKVIYMAAGGVALLGFLFSDHGHGLLALLSGGKPQ